MPSELTLGADTLVAVDGDILGKPRDATQAREYVARLAGRTHEVVGGDRPGPRRRASPPPRSRSPRSTSAPPRRPSLDWYVRRGEWQGRAGGYAIQGSGAVLVAGIEGDYLNVVGLPLARCSTSSRPDPG